MSFRFLGGFLLLLLALFAAELTAPEQDHLVQPWTDALASVSGRVASVFDAGVSSAGAVIVDRASGFGVRIVAGCNGVEALIVLAAAILAFRAPWNVARTIADLARSDWLKSLHVAEAPAYRNADREASR